MRTDTLKAQRPDTPLVGDEEFERLRLIALQYRARRHAADSAAGARPGRRRGEGMELHDTRAYQPGDDVRHMDWRATARSGKPVTKVFVAERAHDVCLLVDRRPSMMFGTRRELKAATAARIAATLAFQALAEHGTVSGLVLGETAERFPPRGTLAGALPLLRRAAAAAPAWERRRTTVGATAPERIGNAALYLIGDFHDVMDGTAMLTDYLPVERRGDAIAVRIVDEAEQRMSDAGILRLAPPQGGDPIVVDTRDPELRRRYQAFADERTAALAAQCARHGVALFTVTNCRELHPQIAPLL